MGISGSYCHRLPGQQSRLVRLLLAEWAASESAINNQPDFFAFSKTRKERHQPALHDDAVLLEWAD